MKRKANRGAIPLVGTGPTGRPEHEGCGGQAATLIVAAVGLIVRGSMLSKPRA